MDRVLERAAQRRDELLHRRRKLVEQITQVEGELKELDGFFSVAARFGAKENSMQDAARQLAGLAAGAWPAGEQAGGVPLSAFVQGVQGVPHGSKTKAIVTMSREIISEHGALPARKILDMLDERGAGETLIPGRDVKGRISYLSAVLSKDEQFKSDRDAGGYTLAEAEGPQRPATTVRRVDVRSFAGPGRRADLNPYKQKVNPGAENTGDTDDLLK